MFNIDPLDFARALGDEVGFDIYPVVVAAAERSSNTSNEILLSLEIFGGYHDGTWIPFSFEEPHEAQTPANLRRCLRTLFALGILPTEEGVFDYRVRDLVQRRCWAKLCPSASGIPRVLHDGLLPNE